MVIDPLGGGGGGEGEVKPRGSSRHTQTPPSLLHHGWWRLGGGAWRGEGAALLDLSPLLGVVAEIHGIWAEVEGGRGVEE